MKLFIFFFFFSSRRRHTRSLRDWSSDVCSSDLEETLTLTLLGVSGNLKRTLESTNPCESMIEIVRRTQRNVKRWSSGEMALRWTAAGMLEAERQFRRIIGYRDLATLVIAIERDLDRRRAPQATSKEAAIVLTA